MEDLINDKSSLSSLSKDMIEQLNAFFGAPCAFVLSVATLHDLPIMSCPEIAFAGRSNVGKSSLINAIFMQKNLARTSNTPGRTQMLNYFTIKDMCYFVDMPGYGYAEAPKKLVKQWQKLIKDYLRGRATLKRVYLLIDSRHGIKETDKEMMIMLDQSAVSYQVVLTKIDKISENERQKVHTKTQEILKKHGAAHPIVHLTSSEKGTGIQELRSSMFELIHS